MNEDAGGPGKTSSQGRMSVRWEEVHSRLADTGRQLTETVHPSPEISRIILKRRALALAKPEMRGAGNEKRITVVEFDLAGEHYAVENVCVREVIPVREFTPIPGTPPFILGVIAVRGRIVSLMDLRSCLDLPVSGLINGSRAVLLADDNMEFAILADRVIGLRSLLVDSLQPSVTALIGTGAEYLLGVTSDGLIVFDGGKILADPRIIVRSGD
jgi:purine-binding chemotaxis protein CheW